MPRSRNVQASRQRHQRTLVRTKGFFGNKSRLYRYAKDAADRAGQYAYRDRRKRKSEFRKLWIIRINAAVRPHGITYNRFMEGLRHAGIELDRKALSELAIHDSEGFASIVEKAKAARPA